MALRIDTEITLYFQSRLARHISTLLGHVSLDVAFLRLRFCSVAPSKYTARFNAKNTKLYLRRPLVKPVKVAILPAPRVLRMLAQGCLHGGLPWVSSKPELLRQRDVSLASRRPSCLTAHRNYAVRAATGEPYSRWR